jgi:fructokinase
VRNIYTIGETVLDILFRNHEPFTAKAGGACLNTAVTLGRLGHDVQFISEYGLDEVGNFIEHFLNDNNVQTDYVYRYINGKSALALAFLNENNDASYDFYKIYPEERLNIKFPEIQQDDIVLFGSFYAITLEVRKKLLEFIKKAKKNKAIVIYDPNFRKPHLHELKWLKPLIEENISLSRIVRGSNEDFTLIFGTGNSDETYELTHENAPVLLYTANKKGVYLHTPKVVQKFPVRQIKPVSTIGAGDNFNAGIIYSLMEYNIKYKDLPNLKETDWQKIIENGVEFASQVCMSYDNYISEEAAATYKHR